MKLRVLTAIGLFPIVLGALFCASPWPILALACVAALICAYELATMYKSVSVWLGIPFILLMTIGHLPKPIPQNGDQVVALGGLILGVVSTFWWGKNKRKNGSLVVVSGFWYVTPLYCLYALHALPGLQKGWYFATPALLAIVPLWGGDTAAIFVGKAFGKHQMAPAISPKKTWEGAIANLLACVIVAVPLGMWIGYSWPISLACGAVKVSAGIFGQLGDLFESYVKRQAGVKDSGTLLPGHGGLLDRIDSILFTAPLVFAILSLVGPPHIG